MFLKSKRFYCFLFTFCNQYLLCESDPIVGTNIRRAIYDKFRFVVSISRTNIAGIENNEKYHICGGTLITRKHVLTSASCKIDISYVSDVVVEVGSTDLRKSKHYEINCWIPYNAWAMANNRYTEGEENDISIITLKRKVHVDIPLAVITNRAHEDFHRTSATTVGWGVTTMTHTPSRYLMTTRLSVLAKGICMKKLKLSENFDRHQMSTSRFLCTETQPSAILECGDGGGPLIINGNEIIGINDSVCSTNSSSKEFNVHLRVDFYKDFIKDIIKSKSAWNLCNIMK